MTNLVDMVFFHADATPEKPAIITGGSGIYSYAMLRRAILWVDKRLRQTGLKAGECRRHPRVGVDGGDRP